MSCSESDFLKLIWINYNNKLTALIEIHLCLEFKTVNFCHAFKITKCKLIKLQKSWYFGFYFPLWTSLPSFKYKKHILSKLDSIWQENHVSERAFLPFLRSIHSFWRTAKEKPNSSLKEALNSTAEWLWKWPPLYL